MYFLVFVCLFIYWSVSVIPDWLTTLPGVILETDHFSWCHITDWPLPLVSYYSQTTPPGVILWTDHSPWCHITDRPLPPVSYYGHTTPYIHPVFFMINYDKSYWMCLYALTEIKKEIKAFWPFLWKQEKLPTDLGWTVEAELSGDSDL